MATRREIRRSIGQLKVGGRKLMELFATATGATTTTIDLDKLAAYPVDTTLFDMYSISGVGGTGVDVDRVVTSFAQATNRLTFTPSYSTFDSTTVAELWQPGWDATIVNDLINSAIDIVREEALQEWGNTSLALEAGRLSYPLPTGARYIHSTQIFKKAPLTGWPRENQNTFRSLFDAAARTQLAQGFQIDSTSLVRGVVLYLRKVGTMATARTLTVNIETNTAGLPSTTEVSGASATRSSDFITSFGTFIFFDFGRPVNLTADTQYHITLAISGSADASNYIQWGEDNDGGYGDGALSTASDAGVTWTAVSASDMLFHIVPWADDWEELGGHEWALHHETSQSFITIMRDGGRWLPTSMGHYPNYSEGQPVRLLGLARAARPTSDTTDLDVPRSFIESKVLALIFGRLGVEYQPMAQHWEIVSQRELRDNVVKTRLPTNSTRATTSG